MGESISQVPERKSQRFVLPARVFSCHLPMDRYQKVVKPKSGSPINENEIRITSLGAVPNYINYAIALLQDKHVKEIVLKAMGQAISKTVAIAEILKKRVPRLHQDTAISSVSITDVWEPIEEGLVPCGDDSPGLNDIYHLVNQRAKQEFCRVSSSTLC